MLEFELLSNPTILISKWTLSNGAIFHPKEVLSQPQNIIYIHLRRAANNDRVWCVTRGSAETGVCRSRFIRVERQIYANGIAIDPLVHFARQRCCCWWSPSVGNWKIVFPHKRLCKSGLGLWPGLVILATFSPSAFDFFLHHIWHLQHSFQKLKWRSEVERREQVVALTTRFMDAIELESVFHYSLTG